MTTRATHSNSFRQNFLLKARDHAIALGKKTHIMGVINVTPDSFSGDGTLKNKNHIVASVRLALRHINDGADMIDIGGESSRPGAKKISTIEEINRVIPLIKKLTKVAKVPISVDTYKGTTAQHALDAGASIINNIQGIKSEKNLLKMVARYQAGIVLMHMRGNPLTMQRKTSYQNLIMDIIHKLKIALENCLEIGIKSDSIIIDPGIGFAKTPEQNLEILHQLSEFKVLKKPILIGTSRKSFISKILNCTPNERLAGTIASCVLAATNGAHILRVHDIKPLVQAAAVTDAINSEGVHWTP